MFLLLFMMKQIQKRRSSELLTFWIIILTVIILPGYDNNDFDKNEINKRVFQLQLFSSSHLLLIVQNSLSQIVDLQYLFYIFI
jgi:hypothetical protein